MERIQLGFRFLGSCHRYTVCLNNKMYRNHFYITLYSNASQEIYPDNKIGAFLIQLAQPVKVYPSEIREVGLSELSYSATEQVYELAPLADALDNSQAMVYCDLIAPQIIGSAVVRYLRTLDILHANYDGEFLYENVCYVPAEKEMFRDMRIEILNLSGERIAFRDSKNPLKAVLHFRRVITH